MPHKRTLIRKYGFVEVPLKGPYMILFLSTWLMVTFGNCKKKIANI